MKALPISFVLICLLLQLKSLPSFSQATFTTVPAPNGSWGGAAVGTQDRDGFMWFGSTGLHKFDGYKYTSYYHDPSDSTSLCLNRVMSVYADSEGTIWVGTTGAGLDRLDPETGIFTHFRSDSLDSRTLSSDWVWTILEDRHGKIWVGTEYGGISILDPDTNTITQFRHDPDDANSLSNNFVRVLYEDREGTMWVGTGYPYTLEAAEWKGGGLNRFNPTTQNFTHFVHNPNDPASLIDNRIGSILEDSKGRFWVGTAGDGLHTMDRENGTFKRYPYDAAVPNNLSRPQVRNTISWLEDHICFIQEDIIGNIWIGTLTGGLNCFDAETNKVTHYNSLGENQKDSNQINNFFWSYTSKDGVLWIATRGILYRQDPWRKHIPHYNVNYAVRSVLQDQEGKLWIGTTQGILVYDSAGNRIRSFVYDPLNKRSLSYNTVNSIIEDRNGAVWIGTDKGLSRYEPKTHDFARFLDGELILTIQEEGESSLLLGTPDGVALMHKEGGATKLFRETEGSIGGHNEISIIRKDKAGQLWVGTTVNGLTTIDQNSKEITNYIPGTRIHSILEASDGQLWVGTNRGLYYSENSRKGFVVFTNAGARFTQNLVVYNLLEDEQQALWINTSIGLFRLRRDQTVTFFGENYGFTPPTFATQNNCFKGKKGDLFFGDNLGNGYYHFFPEHLKANTTAPDLHITEFRIADRVVRPGQDGPFALPISRVKEIALKYNQNVFSFDFAGIHYSSPEDNQHLFKMENLDTDWRKAGSEKTAYYYNIPPGNYTFKLKAASSDGVWAEKSIAITISPPWWKTWWAYGIYGGLFMAGIFGTHMMQKGRVIAAERERNRDKELLQAKEIEKAYHDLKTTQAQLVQREKMASLGELTAGIAHEIQNPLNFVNNFSEINVELLSELQNGLFNKLNGHEKEEADALFDDLSKNLEKSLFMANVRMLS